MNLISKENLFENAADFLKKLNAAANHSQMVDLWRSTNFPYKIKSTDPYKDTYREEVLYVYKQLTGMSYDVVNEWTSTLQAPEDFELGYPWMSRNFNVIAEEIGKPIQVLRALHELNIEQLRLIEFGAGWGNLSIPLAKSGVDTTIVDIDRGFLDRAERIAAREGVKVQTICGDFNEVAQGDHGRFNVAVFQSSFHHCLDFERLIVALRTNMLDRDGMILFVNEPISDELQFPWGLRYDGESLWAIMCNKWLELGFHSDFFLKCCSKMECFLKLFLEFRRWSTKDGRQQSATGGFNFPNFAYPADFLPLSMNGTARLVVDSAVQQVHCPQ